MASSAASSTRLPGQAREVEDVAAANRGRRRRLSQPRVRRLKPRPLSESEPSGLADTAALCVEVSCNMRAVVGVDEVEVE